MQRIESGSAEFRAILADGGERRIESGGRRDRGGTELTHPVVHKRETDHKAADESVLQHKGIVFSAACISGVIGNNVIVTGRRRRNWI